MIDIDQDCNADIKAGICPNFVSSPEDVGRNTTIKNNLVLPAGSQCTMVIDSKAELARVMLKEGSEIGVLFN